MIIKNNYTSNNFGNNDQNYKPIGKGSFNEDKRFEEKQTHRVDMYSIDRNDRDNNINGMDDGWKFFKDNTRKQ